MGAKQIGWPLQGDWFYMHRERGSELLFAAAKHVARKEHLGWTLEGFCMNADPNGGWSAHVLMQDADEPPEDSPAGHSMHHPDCCCIRCLNVVAA